MAKYVSPSKFDASNHEATYGLKQKRKDDVLAYNNDVDKKTTPAGLSQDGQGELY
jgi:hypothetical protein